MTDDDSNLPGGCESYLDLIASHVAEINTETASAVQSATNLNQPGPATFGLSGTHNSLIDINSEVEKALTHTEIALGELCDGKETPRQIMSEHADRFKETYDDPVLYLALELVEYNKRKWLCRQPDTNGAADVRRHGLTENQRRSLNELQDAWDAADNLVECAVCGANLSDPKNAGDPDVYGTWVCRQKSCRAAHDAEMVVARGDVE